MRRTAFVMSGGGAKGSFEFGAVDYLIRELKIDPAVIVGVSTGNLNAAMLAQAADTAELLQQLDVLNDIWTDIEGNDDIYKTRFGGIFGLLAKADSIYSNKPLWKLIKKHVDPAKLRASKRKLRIGVVGLKSGLYFAVEGTYPFIRRMVRASAAIPVAFNPVDIDNVQIDDNGTLMDERFVDGGVRNVTPLGDAFDALTDLSKNDVSIPGQEKPDTIYIILASPLQTKIVTDDDDLDDGIEIGKRSLELLVNEVYRNDLQVAVTINEAVKYLKDAKENGVTLPDGFPFEDQKYVDLILIEPDEVYMDSLDFSPRKIDRAIAAGKAKAKQACKEAEANNGTNVQPGMFKKKARVLK